MLLLNSRPYSKYSSSNICIRLSIEINLARIGYSAHQLANVSPERLQRFFQN
jgi:hypothetical protein